MGDETVKIFLNAKGTLDDVSDELKMMDRLIMLLNEDGRLSDIVKVSQDKEYRQKLYLEYHII